MDLPVVSIIIPTYNAARLLNNCLESLRQQTYNLLEIVFVDDCSSDDSNILLSVFKDEMSHFRPNVEIKIIWHEVNKGVAAARNTGLNAATGDYIYYLDADDYLAINAIELLIDRALSSEADIVGNHWVLQFEKKGRMMIQPTPKNPNETLEFMAKGIMRWNLWLFLIKKELYDRYDIQFLPNQNMGEDMMVMFKLLLHARSIAMIDQPIYFYSQSNTESLTKIYSKRHKQEVESNLMELIKYYHDQGAGLILNNIINYLKLNIKLPLLISNSKYEYQEWYAWFSEANSYSLKNNLLSKRIKLLQFMASKRQFWFVKLHYYFVIKLVYGIIYK